MNKEQIKRIIYFIGKFLGILGLIFVFYTLSQEYTLSSFKQQFILFLDILPLLMLLNIASLLMGIYAWHRILLHYSNSSFSFITSYYYFSKTEIAKYLPGNIFHFLGRQALASKIDMTQTNMAKSSLLFSLLLLTGTLLASTFFAFFTQSIDAYILIILIVFTVMSFIILLYLYPSFPWSKKITLNGYLASSVAIQGVMLSWIIMYQCEIFSIEQFLLFASIYTVSWLIGFITPGASGGLGIREGSFIAIATYLHITISTDIIIFSVLFIRLINICVDVIMYFSTIVIEKKMKELEL